MLVTDKDLDFSALTLERKTSLYFSMCISVPIYNHAETSAWEQVFFKILVKQSKPKLLSVCCFSPENRLTRK